jgi:hypothetical protein
MAKIKISDMPVDDRDVYSHLRPIIDFIKAQGNEPHRDEFMNEKSSMSYYFFKGPIDPELITATFDLPESITVDSNGNIHDKNWATVIYSAYTHNPLVNPLI